MVRGEGVKGYEKREEGRREKGWALRVRGNEGRWRREREEYPHVYIVGIDVVGAGKLRQRTQDHSSVVTCRDVSPVSKEGTQPVGLGAREPSQWGLG
jgi:hypothetical protein